MGEQTIDQFKGQPRLPKFAAPKLYNISLKPDLSTCKFTGTVDIHITIDAQTSFLVFNVADLSIEDSSVCFTSLASNQVYRPLETAVLEADEVLALNFGGSLPIGEGVLSIAFSGVLNDQMKGFYRSTYEHNGKKKNMAVTQFEPADARRCFPCWDEPAFKAKFKITLEVPSELTALSNMPVIQEEKHDDHLKIVSFQESPVMSTYLVAIAVGVFDYLERLTPDGTKVRVYCQIGKTNQGMFALDVAVKTLSFYSDYFSTPYPLPKLDLIAIPDFNGAMENYGLVTYQEAALLYDENHSAAANKQWVAIVVAHELAHQWFGNLVTMEWWTHLWLNEGFATWVSYLAVDSLFDTWRIWNQFLDETMSALGLDGLSESHPIEVEINHVREIDEIFDAISYEKGASLIRMLQSYLGAECFQRSLSSYIKKYAYSNAKTEDLWAVLEEESGETVNGLMSSWTKQKGYPVISLTIKDGILEFEQTHFLTSGLNEDGQWIVPITLCCGSYDNRKNFLLKTKAEKLNTIELVNAYNAKASLQETKKGKGGDNTSNSAWIKINVEQTGFYRVKYDDELALRLKVAIESNFLSPADRFGILDDSYALCKACKQTTSSLFFLMDAFREELDYTVSSHLISVICSVATIATDGASDSIVDIKQFFINLLQISAVRLGWDPKPGEAHLDSMLRGEILTALAFLGHELTQAEAVKRFQAYMEDRNSPLLHPDVRKVAYFAVMRTVSTSNRSGYESLLRLYRESDLSQEKARILGSLASSPDPNIVLEALNFLLSSEVRSQDVLPGLAGISREGREASWNWLKDNWEHIWKTWGSGFLITSFIRSIVSRFCSYEKLREVEEFFSTRMNPSITRTLKQSLEKVQINARWVQSMSNEKSLGDIARDLTK